MEGPSATLTTVRDCACSMTATPPDVELSVYGSGSFKTGVAIGDAGFSHTEGVTRLMVSGAQSEMSFHDRNEVSCKADKRWNLYASEKKLRTHRPGGKGGFIISEDMTRFLQVHNPTSFYFFSSFSRVFPERALAQSHGAFCIFTLRSKLAGSEHRWHHRDENPPPAGYWASEA